ncbi:MAG: AAA family ATPase [Candidatus Atribacteria bacterium]|nr:MAG: AAA family ATPase [Candidatus Atribacteria bacterium]
MITEAHLERASSALASLQAAVGKTIVGLPDVTRTTIIALLCRGNVLLEGVPGLGKTLLVKALAQAVGLQFSRIQFTPDLMPADIVGTDIITETNGHRGFEFSAGPLFANVILADEINRATPKTQSALLEAMEERTVTVGTTTHVMQEPYIVLATQNPIEMEGTYPLPEAQLDRFMFKALVRFPTESELTEIALRNTEGEGIQLPTPSISRDDILLSREVARQIPIADEMRSYISRLILATHPHSKHAPSIVREYVEYGASPRAAIALILAAKANALLEGEAHVRPTDIQRIFHSTLIHRLILNFRGEAEGVSISSLLDEIWKKTPLSS